MKILIAMKKCLVLFVHFKINVQIQIAVMILTVHLMNTVKMISAFMDVMKILIVIVMFPVLSVELIISVLLLNAV
jgi:hypothetical protein